MPIYKVKLTYKYVDYVEVEAETERIAKDEAIQYSDDAQYESLYDAEVIGVIYDE